MLLKRSEPLLVTGNLADGVVRDFVEPFGYGPRFLELWVSGRSRRWAGSVCAAWLPSLGGSERSSPTSPRSLSLNNQSGSSDGVRALERW
jgi:hypothetical protein